MESTTLTEGSVRIIPENQEIIKLQHDGRRASMSGKLIPKSKEERLDEDVSTKSDSENKCQDDDRDLTDMESSKIS